MLSIMKEVASLRQVAVPHSGRPTDCTRVLDALGVSYFIWYADGRSRLSDAAIRIFPDGYLRKTITAEASALARAALHESRLRPAAPEGLVFDRRVRAAAWKLELAAFSTRATDRDACALVVILPTTPAGADRFEGKGLTRREHDVALLIAEGQTTKEISASLAISTHTARHHTEQIFKKLGVTSRFMLAAMINRPVADSSDALAPAEVG